MYKKKLNEDIRCPLEYGINLIGGKWRSRILCLLGNIGPMHFSELKSDLVNVTDGVLASVLNDLIAEGLIEKSDPAKKYASDYRLTEKGYSLLPLFQELCRWSIPYYRNSDGIITGHCDQCEFYRKWSEENN